MDGFLLVLESVVKREREREKLLVVTCCSIVRKVFVVCRNLGLPLLCVIWERYLEMFMRGETRVTIVIHRDSRTICHEQNI